MRGTESPTQVVDAGLATLETPIGSLQDAANGADRPHGVAGTESGIPSANPRFLEGPVVGLLVNGPLR